MRQPLEDGNITVSRALGSINYLGRRDARGRNESLHVRNGDQYEV